jgi:hypothetical protein
VAIAPDLGERYLDTIYQTNWLQDLYGEDVLSRGHLAAVPDDEDLLSRGQLAAVPGDEDLLSRGQLAAVPDRLTHAADAVSSAFVTRLPEQAAKKPATDSRSLCGGGNGWALGNRAS